jgi:hypothetical protein
MGHAPNQNPEKLAKYPCALSLFCNEKLFSVQVYSQPHFATVLRIAAATQGLPDFSKITFIGSVWDNY